MGTQKKPTKIDSSAFSLNESEPWYYLGVYKEIEEKHERSSNGFIERTSVRLGPVLCPL